MTEFTMVGVLIGMGTAAGLAFQRSRLCFVSALRDLYLFRAVGMTRGILLLLLLAGAGGWVLASIRATLGLPQLVLPQPDSHLILMGGVLFGMGMVLTGSCAAGALWRLGEGQMSQWWILAGLLGGYQVAGTLELAMADRIQIQVQRVHPAWSLIALALGVLALTWWERRQRLEGEEIDTPSRLPRFRRPWSPAAGAFVVALLLMATLALTEHSWRVTKAFLLTDLRTLAFVMGLVLGGHLGARLGREWRVRQAGSWPQRWLRLGGGLLMGIGARIGWGCTVGALMSGMALGASQAWIWVLGAIAGAYIGALLLRRVISF